MFKNIALKNEVAHMTVLTTGVVTRKAYVSIVMAGTEIIDMEVALTEEEAGQAHAKFVEMCEIFAPLHKKVTSNDPALVQQATDELNQIALLIEAGKQTVIH